MPGKNKIKSLINPSIYFLILSGLVLSFGPKSWWPDFYSPVFLSIAFLSSAFLIILPKLIFKSDDACKKAVVVLLQSALSIAFVLNALGEIYLYQLYRFGIQYDKIIHFADAFLFVIVSTFFIEIWYKRPVKKALKMSIIIVLAGSFLWEVFEFSSDFFFKTKEFGIYGQYKVSDTIFDIIFNIIGIAASAAVLLNSRLSKKIFDEYCRQPISARGENDNSSAKFK